jgi:ADP-heptose:LPS heptosyltransferase
LFLNKNSDVIIYKNNKDINLITNKFWWFFLRLFFKKEKTILIDMEDKEYHYWISDTKEKIQYREDGHAIAIACKPFRLKKIELKTRLNLTNNEIKKTKKLMNESGLVNHRYICIEPNAKKTFTANKQWPIEHWQILINFIRNWSQKNKLDYKILQIGAKNSLILDGVISVVGKTHFRDIKYIIDKAEIVIANEGGVAHLASSTDTKALIIGNPSLPSMLMSYPQNINIFPEKGHHNCGFKKTCPQCQSLLKSITPEFVFEKLSQNIVS